MVESVDVNRHLRAHTSVPKNMDLGLGSVNVLCICEKSRGADEKISCDLVWVWVCSCTCCLMSPRITILLTR